MLALVIACVGLYGTVAFNVARRTNEIGIRMALGARGRQIVWMVLREIVLMTAIGAGASAFRSRSPARAIFERCSSTSSRTIRPPWPSRLAR